MCLRCKNYPSFGGARASVGDGIHRQLLRGSNIFQTTRGACYPPILPQHESLLLRAASL